MSLISIGLSGLTASSAAMSTIGNNTANVDTAGYSRQQVMTTASLQQNLGAGYIGSGTTLSDVRRIYNSYLETQLQTSTALGADATAYSAQATKTDTLLSDTATGISPALASFFTNLQGVSTNATDTTARSLFLQQASALSARFNSIAAQLNTQNSTINTQLTTLTDQVNSLSSSIAKLNQQITSSAATGATPNSLLDARSESVRQLNELVGAKVVENNGNYDVYIGTGQALVNGSTANAMSAVPSAADPAQYSIKVASGSTTTDVTSVITGGSIGGLLRYRNEVMAPAINELGRVALVLSDQVNSQLNQGVDSNGEFGSNLFNSINDPSQVSQRSIGKTGNSSGSGNLDVTITDTSKLSASDYSVTFTDDKNFTVRRLPDGTSVGAGSLDDDPAKEFEGFTVSLNGNAVAAGDTFTLTPTRNAAAALSTVITDPKDLAAAAPLTATAGASNSGTAGFTQPTLTSIADIYDTTATTDLRNGIKDTAPLKLLFGAAVNGAQSYQLLDAQGNAVLDKSGTAVTGTIVPGQANALSLKVGYQDSTGAAQEYSFDMTISGAPANKDTFNIALTGAGSADNRNAIQTLDLQTRQTIGVGVSGSTGLSMSGAYGALVSNVGIYAAQGKTDVTSTGALVTQSKSARDAVSGVSLDEEAANLIKYQQYYTASSQIIKAAQAIFSTLINSL
ncbi:MAG TPA: flagellar hook-associated protein FlgK [Pseudomonas sp.]|jgi:flagellar hook-associated protein 1 FlgK